MFERRLHPSPIGLALGLTLVALWAALWIGLFATFAAEARAQPSGVARLALMPDGEDDHFVEILVEDVKRDVPCLAARNQQLSQAVLDLATDERVTAQYSNGVFDQADRARGDVLEPLEILERRKRVLDHPRETGFGRAGFFPATRAFRYA